MIASSTWEFTVMRSANRLRNFSVLDGEGALGRILDLLVDWRDWVIRYFIVCFDGPSDSRSGRLVSPIGISGIEWSGTVHLVDVREKIDAGPPVTRGDSVTRQTEIAVNRHFGWLCYWAGGGRWRNGDSPLGLRLDPDRDPRDQDAACGRDDGSAGHLIGLQQLPDYAVGSVSTRRWIVTDLLIEERTFGVAAIVLSQGNGSTCLIESGAIKDLDRTAGTISLSRPSRIPQNSLFNHAELRGQTNQQGQINHGSNAIPPFSTEERL
jgi:hypothetical protein